MERVLTVAHLFKKLPDFHEARRFTVLTRAGTGSYPETDKSSLPINTTSLKTNVIIIPIYSSVIQMVSSLQVYRLMAYNFHLSSHRFELSFHNRKAGA
jgi:hypothetical protein